MPAGASPHISPYVKADVDVVKTNLSDVQKTIVDTAKSMEKSVLDGHGSWRSEIKTMFYHRAERMEQVQNYLAVRIKERPLTATLAGLAVGFVLGFQIANRRN